VRIVSELITDAARTSSWTISESDNRSVLDATQFHHRDIIGRRIRIVVIPKRPQLLRHIKYQHLRFASRRHKSRGKPNIDTGGELSSYVFNSLRWMTISKSERSTSRPARFRRPSPWLTLRETTFCLSYKSRIYGASGIAGLLTNLFAAPAWARQRRHVGQAGRWQPSPRPSGSLPQLNRLHHSCSRLPAVSHVCPCRSW
jgi:hypothetical protein